MLSIRDEVWKCLLGEKTNIFLNRDTVLLVVADPSGLSERKFSRKWTHFVGQNNSLLSNVNHHNISSGFHEFASKNGPNRAGAHEEDIDLVKAFLRWHGTHIDSG